MRVAQFALFAATLACSLPFALTAPLTSPPRSFFTRSCNATCGLDLSHQLVDQPTALDRFKLLNTSSNNFVFNFFDNANVPEGPDGKVVLATAGNFPSAIGNGVAMGVGFMGPCGLNVPHLHPRAGELLYVSKGDLVFGTIQENGASFVTGVLKTGEATIFPQGSIHFQQNLDCNPAQFIAAFGSEDPGRLDIAPAFFQDLPATIVNATLGGIGVKEVEDIAAKIPLNVAFGTQACLDRCGISRPGQWTAAAIEEAKRQFNQFMSQGPYAPVDFTGLPSP
ncbi:RmlC-like cupin [Punctularia strigosozonata HHB-11173 SS5]|uniref:RmlC-like cupin n=1 Tax=Punctularia strigosozonata (strain HHB-11173) TaxID=741275 RepID=UPI0004418701|nr:RmlC-like cupin [Punctularia strigosozonata HHB-11173 SS5]EIN08820.1 RmlC-like cupin [Punctularia strigosozonata HHB-11173 SS5]